MNNLTDFYIAFNTVGLLELTQGLDKLHKKMDDIETGFSNMAKGSGKTSSSFMGFLGKLGLVASAATIAAKAVQNAFSVGDRAIELRNMADAADVAADKIEALGLVLRKYGGDERTAGAMYGRFRDLIKEYNQGKIPQNQREVMARYGFSVRPGMTPEQVQNALAQAMHSRVMAGDIGGRNQIAEAFGLDRSTMLALSNGVKWLSMEVNEANKHLVLSNDDTMKNAEELREARQQLSQTWDKISAELIPVLASLLQAIEPLADLLAPIATWALKQTGGTLSDATHALKYLFGDESDTEFLNYYASDSAGPITKLIRYFDPKYGSATVPRTFGPNDDALIAAAAGAINETFGKNLTPEMLKAAFPTDFVGMDEIETADNVSPFLYGAGGGNVTNNNTTNYGNTIIVDFNGQEVGRIMPDGTFVDTMPGVNVRGNI